MLPIIALVGRPNVGKSTLFNRLTRTRNALVADLPGLTRDRQYGRAQIDGRAVTLVDTGGLVGERAGVARAMEDQAELAITQADHVLLLVDARAGLHPVDTDVAARLRRQGKPVTLVINKVDGVDEQAAAAEFAALGIADSVPVSASHGRGMSTLCETVARVLPVRSPEEDSGDGDAPGVAVIGRPNVGKSTLINRLVGEDRQVVFDEPGTTRDAVVVPFSARGREYRLIDTAGVRRKGRVTGTVEKISVVKTLEALERSAVAILVIDARDELVDQDLHMLGYAVDAGCGVVLAVNKWDGLDTDRREAVKRSLDRKLRFARWCPLVFVSALHGTGVGLLFKEVARILDTAAFDASTPLLTRILTGLVADHPPPSARGRPIKLRYAHKHGEHPPTILVHGNRTDQVPASYVRYLENGFRDALGLYGTPVEIRFKTGENPYAGRRNQLSPRQRRQRQRVIAHSRRGRERGRRRGG